MNSKLVANYGIKILWGLRGKWGGPQWGPQGGPRIIALWSISIINAYEQWSLLLTIDQADLSVFQLCWLVEWGTNHFGL